MSKESPIPNDEAKGKLLDLEERTPITTLDSALLSRVIPAGGNPARIRGNRKVDWFPAIPAGGDPVVIRLTLRFSWFPACAGMTLVNNLG